MAQEKQFTNGVVDSSSDETDSLPLLTLTFPINSLCNTNNLSQVFLQNGLNDDTMYLQDLEDGNTGWTLDGLPVLFTSDGQPILLNTLSEVNQENLNAASTDDDQLHADTTFNTLQTDVFSTDSLSKLTVSENLPTDELLSDTEITHPLELSNKVIITEDGLVFPVRQETCNEVSDNIPSDTLHTSNVSQNCDVEVQTDIQPNKMNFAEDQNNVLGLSSELSELAYVITIYKCKRCLFTCSDKQIFLEHFRDSHLQHLKNSISNTAQLLSKQTIEESDKNVFTYKSISLPDPDVQGIQNDSDVTSPQLTSNVESNVTDDLQSSLRQSFVFETDGGSIEIDASTLINPNIISSVDQSSEKLDTIMTENIEEMDCTVSSSEQEQFDEFVVATKNIKEEPLDIEEKYIYLCSQCSNGFTSILDCRQHMIKDHKLKVVDTWEQRMTEGKVDVSTGTSEIQSSQTKNILVSLLNDPKVVNVTTSANTITPVEIVQPENNVTNEVTAVDVSKKIASKSFLKLKKGNGPLPFRCVVRGCSYRFSTQEVCDRHVQCHQTTENNDNNNKSVNSLYKCSECNQPQRSWRVTAMHLWRQHNIQTDLLTCPICHKHKAATPVKLQDHMKIHSDVRSYVCPDCGSAFKQPSQLRNHRIVHLDKHSENIPSWYREKECTQCQKIFSDAKCLKKHIQSVHSKLKPFICNVCGHSCARKAMLQMHLRQHTGEKPYECPQCPYKTGDHNSLRRHKMKHSGIRPYKCPHCPYSSIQSNAYKIHILSKHPGKTGIYSCAICSYLTVSEEGYLGHVADHAKGLIQSNTTSKNDLNKNGSSDNSISSTIAGTNILFFTTGSKNADMHQHDGTNNAGQKSPTSSDNDELCYLQTDINDEQCLDTGGITIPAEPDCASLLSIQPT